FAVGDEQKTLPFVVGECQVPRRAYAERLGTHGKLLHKLALLAEDLNAVVRPVANVDETVLRDVDAVDGTSKLLIGWGRGRVGTGVGIGGLVSVGAPHALEGAGFGIEHDDALIAVAVGDVDLVRGFVHLYSGGAAQDVGARTVHRVGRGLADLHQESALAGELQH